MDGKDYLPKVTPLVAGGMATPSWRQCDLREMVRNNVANVKAVPEARRLIDRFLVRGLGTFQPTVGPGPQSWVIALHQSG
jgi:hypothetical protein